MFQYLWNNKTDISRTKLQSPPPTTLDDIPNLIDVLYNNKDEKCIYDTTKRIYQLCDVNHKENRIPIVNNDTYDILTPLAKCLTTTQTSSNVRHIICLIFNNLSIPDENKHVMSFGPASKDIINALCMVLAEEKQESYLCCICLMNLTFSEASISRVLYHSPGSVEGSSTSPLDNPDSLLRILEQILTNSLLEAIPNNESNKSEGVQWVCNMINNLTKSEENTSLNKTNTNTKSDIPKSEIIHWACGLIVNCTKSKDNASLIGMTNIPKCVVENIRTTSTPPSCWTSNSIEDFSFSIVLNLAQWPVSREVLVKCGAVDVIQSIMTEGNLQEQMASRARAFLDNDWSASSIQDDYCGDNPTPVKMSVSEGMMTNIV